MKIECKTRRRIVAKKPQNIVHYYSIIIECFSRLRQPSWARSPASARRCTPALCGKCLCFTVSALFLLLLSLLLLCLLHLIVSFPSRCAITSLFRISHDALLPLSLFYVHKTRDVIIILTTRITEPQLHAGFAVAGAFTAEWLVQKEQSLQKEVDALVSERRERNKEFKQRK